MRELLTHTLHSAEVIKITFAQCLHLNENAKMGREEQRLSWSAGDGDRLP